MAKFRFIAGRRTEVRRGTLKGAPRCLATLILLVFTCSAQQTAIAVEEAVAPTYPAAAVEGGIAGTVTVEARISEAGTVVSAAIAEGHALLRQACLGAARLWRFSAQPASRDVKLTFLFRLMPNNTPEAQLGAVFRPPYTVEVRRIAAEKVTHYAHDNSQAAPGAPPERDRPPG
jgi:TonB family protein